MRNILKIRMIYQNLLLQLWTCYRYFLFKLFFIYRFRISIQKIF